MQTWLLAQLHPASPGFWIIVSILFWVPIQLSARRWSERQYRWLNLARWIGLPYAALLTGSLSPRLMGLTNIDWVLTLENGIILLAIIVTLMAMVRFSLQRSEGQESMQQVRPVHPPRWPHRILVVLTLGALQFHWSFLRAAVWEVLLLQTEMDLPGYWAVWIAAALALPEVLLFPLGAPERLLTVTILVLTSVLFIFTHNFWLCWALHAIAWQMLSPIFMSQKMESAV